MSQVPSIPAVVEELLRVAGEDYKASGQLSPDVLVCLHIIHGQCLHSSLDLVDNHKVVKAVSTSGRWLYQVTGSAGTPYYCFPHSIYCQCMSFRYAILKKREQPLCKHVLAARLADEMGLAKERKVSDEYIMDVLANVY